ncbi:pilus assembly protein PilC [Nocardioides sp. Root1257]|uniref:type II secretion system F family protein n=1 Tax=unclassified Nocardioides TaxID=2615069 RepID=UPI0006FB7DB2|nr:MULTISPECIES: type II secretion system F family protein [unclassified Nocardioides]KQW46039.1 pilus assembly protein PilC [Nocardioides sp. Root1257]KRC43302.1 pilus assembly protein PilC [Nocardioides sp. Root224]
MTVTATQYSYKVRDTQGRLSEGKVEAASEGAVADKLRAMGYVPLEVRPANVGMQREIKLGFKKRVKTRDLAVFSRQFATMIDAGLTMTRALTIMAEQSENEALRAVLRAVKQEVESGLSLSAAFARHPDAFPPLMVSMTRAGEAGGFLDRAMRQIADNFEAEVKLRGKIKAALTYPVVVFVLAMLMCVAMLIFVVPVFRDMFANLGGELPLPTRVLVWLSDAMKFLLPLGVVAGIAFTIWWRRYGRTERVRNVVDPAKLKLPVFGKLFQKLALTRFARNLGTLLSSGVPILQSIDIVSETTGSIVISRALKEVQESVRRGESVAGPLAAHEVFPPMVVQMIASGEEAGATDQMLMKVADFYDSEVEAMTESLTALIEPLMIAFLGLLVGSMIVALYMPIFKVFDMIG